MPDGISVGSVTVSIVPDTRNFRREMDAKLQDLTADVRLELQDKAFRAELDEATRDRTVNVRVDDKGSINKMQGRTHALLTTLTLLAPAAAPLTAVAIGGAAALSGLGVAGLLAVKGIQNAMAAGTPEGLKYTGLLNGLQSDLRSLEATAASGVLDGFTQSAELVNGQLPQLRSEVKFLAQSLGSDLAPVTSGLLSLFRDLDPTVDSIAGGIHNLAVDFEGWASGPGGTRFTTYLQQVLPQVEHTLEALVGAGSHLVSALLPLGGPVLKAIEGVSTAISAIPVSVIEDMFIAFAAYKTITLTSSAIDGVTAAIKRLAAAQAGSGAVGGAAKGVAGRVAGTALGAAGGFAAVGAAGVGLGALGDQLLTAHGAKIDNKTAQGIVSSGVSGFNAQRSLQAQQQAQLAALQGQQLAAAQSGDESTALGLTPKIQQLQTKVHDLGVALSIAEPLMKQAAAQNVALGLTADGTADRITGETAALASLIKDTDEAANAAQGLESANINVHQATADATAALKANGKTLDESTQKGRDNRTALLDLVKSQRAKIDADAASGKSQKKVNDDTATSILQVQDMAIKFGLSGKAAHDYALKLLGIPDSVVTSITVNGIAKSEAQIAALKKKEGALQFFANQKGHAAGGLITGAGTSTSDSILTPTSNGEYVIQAATVKALGVPFFDKLNTWTPSAPASSYKPPASMGVAGGGERVAQYIYPAPGMSEVAIGRASARQLEQTLSR